MAHTSFGARPDGTHYVIELGANWVNKNNGRFQGLEPSLTNLGARSGLSSRTE